MFCPQCGAEYREGFSECSDCQVALVGEAPPEDLPRPDLVLETVFDSTRPVQLGLAKSVLDGARIEFVTIGENSGGVFSGNPFLGHIRIQVEAARADEAKSLLSEIAESEPPLDDADDPPLV